MGIKFCVFFFCTVDIFRTLPSENTLYSLFVLMRNCNVNSVTVKDQISTPNPILTTLLTNSGHPKDTALHPYSVFIIYISY